MRPVILLTGFLGSGKTTLLRSLLAHPDMCGTAVIINEFGEIGIDQLLVHTSLLEPVLLPNGCLCCTSRGQLVTSLQNLTHHAAFAQVERVIVETSGLADPVPLLQTLVTNPALSGAFRLGGVVTTVDGVNGAATLARFEQAVSQVAIADRLLITKTDIATAEAGESVKRRVRAINPGTQIIEVVSGAINPRDLAGLTLFDAIKSDRNIRRWLGAESPASRHADMPSHGVETFHIRRDRPLIWSAFIDWMEMLTTVRGDDLLRVKGIINVQEWPDEPVVIHGVQHVFHPPARLRAWPDQDRHTRIVFITRGLARNAIDATLHLLDRTHAGGTALSDQLAPEAR